MAFKPTKEWFIRQMEEIVKTMTWLDRLWDAEVFGESFLDTLGRKIEHPANMLRDIMNDKADWIGYWMWELDCGRRWRPGSVEDDDGTEIKLETIEDLWNALRKEEET